MRTWILAIAGALALCAPALAEDPPAEEKPTASLEVQAENKPNDWGGKVRVEWRPSPAEKDAAFQTYRVFRSPSAEGPWTPVCEEGPNDRWKRAPGLRYAEDGEAGDAAWFYRVVAVVGGVEGPAGVTAAPAVAKAEWFNVGPETDEEGNPLSPLQQLYAGRYKNLLAVFLFAALILGWIWATSGKVPRAMAVGFFVLAGVYVLILLQTELPTGLALLPLALPGLALAIPALTKGRPIYVRPIAAVQAVEEAIGRATEMGKPILYVPGISSIEDVATLASLNILAPVAEKAAQYDSKLIVPNYDPIVFTVTQEVVKEAYLKAGRPDAYSDDNVFFLTPRQFAYVAAVNGIMVREKPATNFFLGMFYAESLLLAETGNLTGAIQIAGTDAVTQLPFFIVSCDYTLIGEELYAAGAYMGGDPRLVGGLKGQDWNKAIVIGLLCTAALVFLVYGLVEHPDAWPKWLKELPAKILEVRQ